MESATTGSRTSRGEATAARLRGAARRVFAAQGYAATRVEDIVAEAGVSHGTFYTYYENKAAVLDALVDETAIALQQVAEGSWEGPDVASAVEGVIGRFVREFASQTDVIRVWLEASAHEQHFRERVVSVRRDYTEKVANILESVTRGTDHDPHVAAGALVSMVEGYAADRFDTASGADREAAVRTLAAIWVGGMRGLGGDDAAVDAE